MIVTITPNPSVDLSTATDNVEPDRKLRCDEPVREPGGGGLNVARVIARLGGDVVAVWARGGPTGELLHGLLDEAGLPHQPVSMPAMVRESVAVFERSSGRQFRFNMPGPALSPGDLDGIITFVRQLEPAPSYVVGSGSLPPGLDSGFFSRLGEAVVGRGGRFVLDTHGEPLREGLASGHAFLIKPNLRELSALAGRTLRDDRDIEDAARSIIARGQSQAVFASLGAAGALVVTADGAERLPAPAVPIHSRIGAGDSTVAGLVLALARGESIGRAARFAVASGAAAVMTPGTQLCRREDVERLFAQMA